MMFNFRKLLTIISIILTLIFLIPYIKVQAMENKVAIIYDSYNEFGSEENKLNFLVNAVLKTGKAVDLINVNSYEEGSSNKYDNLIILYNNSAKVPEKLNKDLLKIQEKVLWVGKKFNQLKDIEYIPNFSLKDASCISLEKKIYTKINGKEWNDQRVYILMDKVYPFINLNKFTEKIDFLHDRGYSFICSVMPVYENQDFEAMKRFCEVLRYAQIKGGKIILHSSVVIDENIPGKNVKDKMDLAQQNYIKYGVYPVALDISQRFLYREDYKELIDSTNTVFVDKENNVGVLDFKSYSIASFNRVIDKVEIKDENFYKNSKLTHDVAFKFDADLKLDSFKNEIDKILKKGLYFNDVDYIESSIKLGAAELSCSGSNIFLNNKPIEDGNDSSKNQNTVKENNVSPKEGIDISKANRRILSLTFFTCSVFALIVFVSTRIDRRKYFK